MPPKLARTVGMVVGFAVALAGLGCGKSCEDVTADYTAEVVSCAFTNDCECQKKAYNTAIDEDACDDAVQNAWVVGRDALSC